MKYMIETTENGCQETIVVRIMRINGGLEERLQTVYGECDELLKMVVEHLERHEGINFPESVHKARLLTDGEVDRWEKFGYMHEKVIQRIEEIKATSYYPHNFTGQMVDDLEWVLSLLN